MGGYFFCLFPVTMPCTVREFDFDFAYFIGLSLLVSVADPWAEGGRPTPLLTACILKQVKILHENATFSHTFLKNFLGKGHTVFLPRSLPLPFRPPSYYKLLDPLVVSVTI